MLSTSIVHELELPAIVPLQGIAPDAFIEYYHRHQALIDEQLLIKGAIKFRGVSINSLEDFQHIVDHISTKFLRYIDGNSPRTKLSGNVYTSTEYDQTQRITMHNELSYSAKWPHKLFFSCLQPAETGGETLLADSRKILHEMDETIVSTILDKGILYTRNLHGGKGMGPSWQDTFESEDKNEVEAYCQAYGIDFEWTDQDMLRLKQTSPGIIEHRITKEKCWFNQVDQFHPCHLGKELYETLQLLYNAPENFPMYVSYGDGTPIPEAAVQTILQIIDRITVAPEWRRNELLIVDNELVSHGRNAYTGNRKVLVAMSE